MTTARLRDELARLLCESPHVWCSHDDIPDPGCEQLADTVLGLIREADEADRGR